ncbi:MAG: competence/damage-inducible protein A [Gammaproteobacteria bacterium]|nr:MAG: competence/damage-inducible protein A [Gammaproteobacteria bacterium]
MNSAIITIGDEILIGQVVDTNAVWISQQLNANGVRVGEMVTISDDSDQIRLTLDRYMGKYDLLIMTGGLGPTKDDMTKQTLAEYFNSKMITHPEVQEKIISYFRDRGRSMIESNRSQADVPDNCRVLMNHHGTAPGMWFEQKGTILVSLPGVPYEMKGLMNDHLIPEIQKRVVVPHVVHKTIMTQGVPESYLAELLKEWEEGLPDCVKLAYLPRPGIVRLRLTIIDKCASEAEQMLEVIIGKLLNIIPQHIFGYDDMSLEESLGKLLKENKLTLSTAESCTGGNIARLITSVPGSSGYFTGSVIAYENRIKSDVLGVDALVIDNEGAVSKEVVEQMARGIMDLYGTNAAIATSGIAGPDGGTEEKPVGTVWLCVTYGDKILTKKFRFSGTRDRIIDQASFSAMQLLRRVVLDMA